MAGVQLGVDQRSLDALRHTAKDNPKAAVKQAADQFEALFMRQLLKTMRDSIPKSGLTDSAGERMAQDLLDDQLVSAMVGLPGGLGATIARHLSRYMPEGSTPGIEGADAEKGASSTADGVSRQPAALAPSLMDFRSTATAKVAVSRTAAVDVPAGAPGDPDQTTANELPAAILSSLLAGRAEIMGTREARFVTKLWPHAQAAEQATGVPAAYVIGQAALESGWGGGEMRHPDGRPAHNLFGIKAGSNWSGETVAVMTTEYIDGRKTSQVERFRSYDSYESAFSDWIALMTRQPRYREVLRNAGTAESFAQGLQAAGYATDPDYGDKLQRVIQRAIQLRDELA